MRFIHDSLETENVSIDEIGFGFIDDSNIPVNIAINQEGDEWVLQADNYMPLTSSVAEDRFTFIGTKEEIQELIQKKILPLYKTAVHILENMFTEFTSLYFWDTKFNRGE